MLFFSCEVSYNFADPIPEDLAHASAPIHLDDVVSAEVINTERHKNGHTDMNDRNNSNRKGKKEHENLHSGDNSDNKTTHRLQNKDATVVIPRFDEDNFTETTKLNKDEGGANNSYTKQAENDTIGMFGDGSLNHQPVNGVTSDSEIGALETELESTVSQIEEKYEIATKTIAESETVSLLHSEAGLTDNSETAKVDNDLNDLQQITERVMENLVIDVIIDNCISGMVTRNSNEMASETKHPAVDKVEYSKSQITNMFNTAPKQVNDELNDKDSEHPNAVKTNKAKHQSFNSKKRQQRERKPASSKQNTALKISQFIKDKAANKQSEPPPKTDKTELDYKAQFASYKPPKLDIVSMFKQTIGHKSLTNLHTYDSAKSELEAHKPDVSDVSEKHTFTPKVERSEDHDALVTAVHELQKMFDRASVRPISVQNEVNSPDSITAGNVEDAGDKDRATKLEKADANSVEPQLETEGLPNKNATKEDAALSLKDKNSGDTKALKALQNEGKADMSNHDAVVKPKKTSRRGFTGKFAIAHMLHQGDLDADKDNVESRSKNEKLHEEISEMNNADEVKNELKDLKNKQSPGNNERLFNFNGANENAKADVSVEDKYMDLVLESQAVEKRMKHKAGVETMEKNRPERKVSFSSDEIVTEDSESDSSSDIESDLEDDQKDIHSYSHSQKASAYKGNTYFEGKARQKLKADRNRNSSDYKGGRKKKESQNEQNEYDSEKYRNFESEDKYYDNKESYDSHAQYIPSLSGFPYSSPHQSSAKHSQRESGFHPPHPQSMPGYPHAFYPDHRQQYYPGNFYNQWYPPYPQPYQQYPMQCSPYSYPTPQGYGSYPVPYARKGRPNEGYGLDSEEEMKEAFELQTNYIRLMCQKGDRGGKEKKKHSKRMS